MFVVLSFVLTLHKSVKTDAHSRNLYNCGYIFLTDLYDARLYVCAAGLSLCNFNITVNKQALFILCSVLSCGLQ